MRVTRILACLALLAATKAQGQPPSRLIPDKADLVVEVRQPRELVEIITKLDSFKQLQQFPSVKELLDSTQYRRFYQLVAYFEKELGADWPELLDKLAGDGAALGVKFGPKPILLLAIQGKDEATMKRFVELAVKVIEQELNRQEAKGKLEKNGFDDFEVWSLGKEFHLVLSGKTLLVSNNDMAMQGGLALVAGKVKNSVADLPSYAAAAKLLPKEPMAKLWLNLEEVHKRPETKELYKNPREPALTVIAAHYIDVFSRSPFLCASFGKEGDEFLTTIRLPSGRTGMGQEKTLHIPADGQAGSRPLLEPKSVIYSSSFYIDVAKIWEDRVAIFGEVNAKNIEMADKNSSKLPFGNLQLSKLLTQAGPYQRIVVAHQERTGYKKTPKTRLPAFAFVTEMRDPDNFSKTLEGVLRGAALFGGNQFGMQLVEEKYKDLAIVSYRFDEEKAVKQDVNDIRFNFTPSFVRVGNQFVVCSTIDLARELVDLLQAEAKMPAKLIRMTSTDRFYSAGIADILEAFEEQLVAQGILDQAIPADEAKQQVKAFIKLVRGLGSLTEEITFEEKSFRFDLRAKAKK